jgi:hypothetical protein
MATLATMKIGWAIEQVVACAAGFIAVDAACGKDVRHPAAESE